MKILITGGNGFLGSAIYKQLNNSNHKVFILDNKEKNNLKGISYKGILLI